MEEVRDEGALEEMGISVAGGDENTAAPEGALDQDQVINLPTPKDTVNNDKMSISNLQEKIEIPDSDADSEISSPVKTTSHLCTVATPSPTVPDQNIQSSDERTLADRRTASADGSIILAAGSDPASDHDILTTEYESSPQDNGLGHAVDGIDEVIEIQDDTVKEVDSAVELDVDLPVITSNSQNEGDTSSIAINVLGSCIPEIKLHSAVAEPGFTSSPMNETKVANAISLAAAAIVTLRECESVNENNAPDVVDSFSDNVQNGIVLTNQRPTSTSLPELEFFKTDGDNVMEDIVESSTQADSLPVSVAPIDHGAEDHEVETGIEPLTNTHNPPATTMVAQRDDGDCVMESSDTTSTRTEILACSAMESNLKEDPSPTPANLTNNDSQHFNEAWKEIMGTDTVPGSSEQSTRGASSQSRTVNAAGDMCVPLASAQLTGVKSTDAEHRKYVDAAEDIVHGKSEGIELYAAVHQVVSESRNQDEDTPMDTEFEFAPQHESDDSNMPEKPDTSMSDVKRSTPLFEETSSEIPSLGLESNHHQSPAQDTDAEMVEGEDDNQLELGNSRVPVVAKDDQKLAKNVPEETGESQSSKKRVIPDSDDEDEDEQHAEDACVLPSARLSPTRAASPRQATLSMAPILSQSTQPEESLLSSSPHAEAASPSEKPVVLPSASFKLPMMNKDPLSSSPVRPEMSSSFLTKTEGQTEAPEDPKDVVMEELKAMKIASLKARNAALAAEIESKRAKLEEVTKTLIHPAAETVKTHIKLLHDYNDIRDIGQGLIGMIADNRGVRIGDLYEEFGVDVKD